jgi:DNA adenine methylase
MAQNYLINMPETHLKEQRLNPIIKWAGGKELELHQILPNLPINFNRYFEPFVGGGAVYFAINKSEMFINDKSNELIDLYRLIKNQDSAFFSHLLIINKNWRLIENIISNHYKYFLDLYKNFSNGMLSKLQTENQIISFVVHNADEFNGILETSFNINIDNFLKEVKRNLINKISRMKNIESKKGKLSDEDILKNVESALKSAYYMHFRHLYNKSQKYSLDPKFSSAIFFFIREFCYASMFRYNMNGDFNVPYGGIQYNRKDFLKKIQSLQSEEYQSHLQFTHIYNLDFLDFLNTTKPKSNDFIFLDPPYDSEFSTYARNSFSKQDQIRLAKYLYESCANFMLVIKKTDFILSLYSNHNFKIHKFSKKYLVSFQDRNEKQSEHLVITNY